MQTRIRKPSPSAVTALADPVVRHVVFGVDKASSIAGDAPRYGHDFGRIRVSPALPGGLQASLLVGQPGDRFEREADLVADQVMRTPADEGCLPQTGQAQVLPELPSTNAGIESIWRAPQEPEGKAQAEEPTELQEARTQGDEQGTAAPAGGEETAADSAEQVATMLLEEDDLEEDQPPEGQPAGVGGDTTVQARELPGQTPTVSSQQETALNALRGGGQQLPGESRSFFEPRFGHDFSHVRIHTGAGADQMARAFRAKAFAVGKDVVFGADHYQPTTPAGRWLIAHELTHVLQQQEELNRTPVAGVQVEHTGHDQVQGGFFGRLWGGVKKAAKAVAGAAKWTAGKVWGGVKAVGKWGWDVLKSAGAVVWSRIVDFPERIWRLIKHMGSGIAGLASSLWEGLRLAVKLDFKGFGKWFVDGILSGAAWVGRLAGKLVDLVGIGEILDLLFQIIKFNTRSLTSGEKSEAQKVFKNSISYWQVRVDEYSLIAKIGSVFSGGGGMGVTTFHTINFNQKITAAPGSTDMRWLTHELTHVSQYEHVGVQYIGEAIHAQAATGYNYNGPTALWRPPTHVAPNTPGRHFREFNREQQGDIAADYYYSLYHNVQPKYGFALTTTDYEPVIDELRNGDL